MKDDKLIEISRVRNDNKTDIRSLLKGRNTPVILHGFIQEWSAYKKWTPDYFKTHFGEYDIQVEKSRLSPAPTQPKEYLATRYYERTNLASTIAEMQEKGYTTGTYIAYSGIFSDIPSLLLDIQPLHEKYGFSHWVPTSLRKKLVRREGFWLGPEGISSPLHFDRYDNLNVQVYGKKRWVLIPPTYSENLYCGQDLDMPVIFSPIDMTCPDNNKFPLLSESPYYDFVLEEGDILYLPPGWWHFVEALSCSINVNYWWYSLSSILTMSKVELSNLLRLTKRVLPWNRNKVNHSKPTSMPR